jgi:radical SAM protein with 4Fe4S-binding SPASM domain
MIILMPVFGFMLKKKIYLYIKLFLQRFYFKEIILKPKYKLIAINKKIRKQIELPGLNETRLQLQLTNICNANCSFCAYGKLGKRYQGVMPVDIFEKAVGQFLNSGGKDFGLNSTVGDPLVDKDAVRRIKYLRKNSPDGHMYFFTNLLFLDKFNIDEFLLSGLNSIYISTTAFDRKIYLRVYGSNLYDRFYMNLKTLLKRNEELNNPIKISINFRLDIPSWQAFKLKDFKQLIPYLKNVYIDATHKFDSWNGILKIEHLSGRMRLNKPLTINYPCYRLKNPSININGDVTVCSCRTPMSDAKNPLVIGNINEKSLNRIWKDKEHLQLFNSFFKKESIPKICADCSFYTPFLSKSSN